MMERAVELYRQRETHASIIFFIMLITNCRYAGTGQPNLECAVLPMVCQGIGAVCFLCGTEGSRQRALKCSSASIGLVSVVMCILSCVHIHHLLQATVSVMNAYCLLVLAVDLWTYQDNECVTSPST